MNYVWWIDGNDLFIGSYDGVKFTPLPSAATLTISGRREGTQFVPPSHEEFKETLEPNIPERFHIALVYGVLKRLYEQSLSTINAAQYNDGQYERYIQRARKFANKSKRSHGTIAGHFI